MNQYKTYKLSERYKCRLDTTDLLCYALLDCKTNEPLYIFEDNEITVLTGKIKSSLTNAQWSSKTGNKLKSKGAINPEVKVPYFNGSSIIKTHIDNLNGYIGFINIFDGSELLSFINTTNLYFSDFEDMEEFSEEFSKYKDSDGYIGNVFKNCDYCRIKTTSKKT